MLFAPYDESITKAWWYPRHPGVTWLDFVGIWSSFTWLIASPHWTISIYSCVLITLYSVSALYHHVQYREWLGKLDHIMIFYVIAITALPYWGMILPFSWYTGGPLIIVAICLIGTIVKIVSFLPRFVSGLAYIAASVPMVSYFIIYQDLIPNPQRILWLMGIILYGLQLGVYTLQRPDPYTERFGYREIQHLILLCATNLHSWVATSLI